MREYLAIAMFGLGVGAGGCCPGPVGPPQASCGGHNAFRCLVGPVAYDKWDLDFRVKFPAATVAEVNGGIVTLLNDEAAYRGRGFELPKDEGFFAAASGWEPNGWHFLQGAHYYKVNVLHDRGLSNHVKERQMTSMFTEEEVPLVRVSLPRSDVLAKQASYYDTNIGRVILHPSLAFNKFRHGETIDDSRCHLRADHWYGSVEELARDWDAELKSDWAGHTVTAVDLVTTAQIRGTRFAAIGFYLAYLDGATVPSFYVIEAGEAFNFARQVYYGRAFSTFEENVGVAEGVSTYNPSHLSDPTNKYKSWLSGGVATTPQPSRLAWEPARLTIKAAHAHDGDAGDPAKNPYITVTATFTKNSKLDATIVDETTAWGTKKWDLMCVSGGRVQEIGEAMGIRNILPWWQRAVLAPRCAGQVGFDIPLVSVPPVPHGGDNSLMARKYGTCLK